MGETGVFNPVPYTFSCLLCQQEICLLERNKNVQEEDDKKRESSNSTRKVAAIQSNNNKLGIRQLGI